MTWTWNPTRLVTTVLGALVVTAALSDVTVGRVLLVWLGLALVELRVTWR